MLLLASAQSKEEGQEGAFFDRVSLSTALRRAKITFYDITPAGVLARGRVDRWQPKQSKLQDCRSR